MDLCFQRVTLQMLTQSRCKSAYLSTFNAFAKVSVLFCIEYLTIKAGCCLTICLHFEETSSKSVRQSFKELLCV